MLSYNINHESPKDEYLDEIRDIYLKTGDVLSIRTRYCVPWGKIIKKSLIENYHIRFDEISNCITLKQAGESSIKKTNIELS